MRTILAALVVTLVAVSLSDAATTPPTICFPAHKWDAHDGDRPCLRVRLYEDGSYRATVREADGDVWRSR